MKKFSAFILTFAFISSLLSCTNSTAKLKEKELTIKRSDNSQITVLAELAVKPEERQHGYMERETIPDGTGMLFVFERDQRLSFWMKNTPHPLSIAYIDSNGKIRDIFDMKPFSLSSIESTVSVRYALEVPQGWFKNNNIKPGDYLILPESFESLF